MREEKSKYYIIEIFKKLKRGSKYVRKDGRKGRRP